MNSLVKEIEEKIDNAIYTFIAEVSKKYNIDKWELQLVWSSQQTEREYKPNLKNSDSESEEKVPKKSKSVTKAKLNSNSESEEEEKTPIKCKSTLKKKCPYVFTKGAKEGEQCGTELKSGTNYCSRHKKYENMEPKKKKVLPAVKTKSISSSASKKKENSRKETYSYST